MNQVLQGGHWVFWDCSRTYSLTLKPVSSGFLVFLDFNSLAIAMNAKSTFKPVFADVSMNATSYSLANLSPSSFLITLFALQSALLPIIIQELKIFPKKKERKILVYELFIITQKHDNNIFLCVISYFTQPSSYIIKTCFISDVIKIFNRI